MSHYKFLILKFLGLIFGFFWLDIFDSFGQLYLLVGDGKSANLL